MYPRLLRLLMCQSSSSEGPRIFIYFIKWEEIILLSEVLNSPLNIWLLGWFEAPSWESGADEPRMRLYPHTARIIQWNAWWIEKRVFAFSWNIRSVWHSFLCNCSWNGVPTRILCQLKRIFGASPCGLPISPSGLSKVRDVKRYLFQGVRKMKFGRFWWVELAFFRNSKDSGWT